MIAREVPDFIKNPRIAGRMTDEPERKRKPKAGKPLMSIILEGTTLRIDEHLDEVSNAAPMIFEDEESEVITVQ